ncbi:cytochrome P450 [Rhizophagus irregularis]|uniref:Cytochrome P450 n=1 Tax=Rhizophagus irregularis TaxID=588596 RepID=A0A2I1HCE7_9GLOM|nr:cytochrome P450 [Rhizophagus irregularis]
MIFKILENFGIYDCVLFLTAMLMTYVAYYYYKYFTRVNPLPGPFPFPFVAILSPKFTNEAIEQTNELFNELGSYLGKLFLKEEIIKENKNKLDFSEWFHHYTIDIVIMLLTGKRSYSMAAYFDTLSDEKIDYPSARVEDSVKLFRAFRKSVMGYSTFLVVPPFIRHYVPFFNTLQTLDFVKQTLNAMIKNRRQEIENTPLNEPLQHDMLTLMIIKNTLRDNNYIETGEAMRSMTDAEIRANMQDGIISGTIKKLLGEIDSIFQGDKMRPITKDNFYSLNYCEAIIKEAACIFPVTHSFTRYMDKPSEIAEYHWPADILFLINIKAIHNNYWEEPNKFNPDRWMVENFEPNKNSFLVFCGRLRQCPGRKLSIIGLVYLTALIFRKYEIDLIDMNAPIEVTSNISLVKCLNLLAEIRPRN